MLNCPIRGMARYPAGALCSMDIDMDAAEIQRKRHALCSKLAVMLEARRRLDEILEYDEASGGGQLVDGAGGAAAAESSDTAGDDDFYPLDDDDEPEEGPMQWQDQLCNQMVYNSSQYHHLVADSGNLDLDYLDDDDGDGDEMSRDIVALGLHVPQIQAAARNASPPFVVPSEPADDSGGGFGAVLASAAAIAGLKKQPAGAWSMDMDMDGAEIQRKSDALRSKLAVLLEARSRLDEIIEHDAGGGGAAADESADTGGDDDFYPLDYNGEPEERPMQWQDQVCRQMLQQDDDHDLVGYLASSDYHGLDDDDGDELSRDIAALGLHVPHIQGTSVEEAADDGDGFGAVPASAAAIAGLRKHRYDGSGRDSMCVICMKSYKKGRRLRVMPCTHQHRFHGRCIREWLSQSNLCPLCRHALPTADDTEQGGGRGGVRRSTMVRVRVNVNPY